jgi:hypothetical protein
MKPAHCFHCFDLHAQQSAAYVDDAVLISDASAEQLHADKLLGAAVDGLQDLGFVK